MTRVLHLLPSDADFESRHQATALASHLDGTIVEFRTLSAVSRAIRANRLHPVVHAWSPTALTAALLMRRSPVIYSCGPEPRWTLHQKFLLCRPAVQIVCPTETLHDLHIRQGIPSNHCHVIRPPAGEIDHSLTRQQLDLAPDDIVLLAAGPSTWAAHHAAAVWCVSILERLDPHYRLLLWGRGPLAEKAADFARQFGQSGMVLLAEQRLGRPVDFSALIPIADLMLHTTRAPAATLPLLQAQAAGLPILSTVTPTATELLPGATSAFLADPPTPRCLAQRVQDWRSAASPATRSDSSGDFFQKYRALYQQ